MAQTSIPNALLLEKYGNYGPRYTSYPTVKQFHNNFTERHFRSIAMQTNEDLVPKPLSLYIHVPFCANVCFYCACNKIITANKNRAAEYLKYLEKEIDLLANLFDADRVVEQLHIGGGTPTYFDTEQLVQLILKLRKHFKFVEKEDRDYSIELDPRQMGNHSLEKLRLLGFNRISIGVQDVDKDVQLAVNRIQPIELTEKLVEEARLHRFKSINLDLIYGLPNQTVKSFSNTLDSVIAMNPDRLAIYHYAHLPNIFKTQKQINEKDLPSSDIKIELFNVAIEKLTGAGYEYIGMDHFAKPADSLFEAQQNGTLQRNFQGYTTNTECDQLGIGVSAISKLADSYSQNHADISEYYKCLNQNKLPIKHGYKLDLDDCLRRHIIMSLICNFKLQFEEIESLYHINFEDYFYNELIELDEMQHDELIVLRPKSIEITNSGRFLIRNICSVFDKHNHNRNQYLGVFSSQT